MFLSVLAKLDGEILSEETWLDNWRLIINAHGGGILKYRNTYYWFSEYKSDTTSVAMVGVTCYSFKDLTNWTYRGIVLPVSNKKGSDIEKGCILRSSYSVYHKGLKMKWWAPEWILLIKEWLFVQRDFRARSDGP